MYKRLQLLLIFVFIVNCIHKTFANSCDTFDNLKRVFNLGEHVFIQYQPKSYLKFDSQYKRIIDRQISLDSLFGDDFYWVDTAFTFTFDECDPILRSDSYCEAVGKADDLVIVIGKRKVDDEKKYGYLSYRVIDDNQLIRISDGPIVWGIEGSGHLTDDFWAQISGLKNSDLYCESSVFVKSRNELIISMYDTTSFKDQVHLMSRKLEDDGQWSNEWTELPNIGIIGMFDINGRVFGFNKQKNAFEFIWSADNAISFVPISNIKELLNCFDNSTVGEPIVSSLIFTSTTTRSTTTSTTSTTPEPIPSSSLKSTSIESFLESEEETNDIKNDSIESIKEETIGPEVEVLDNSSLPFSPEQGLNQRLEESPEETNDWSIVFIVAIIALIAAIIIAVILIVRNKQKSRSVYLNTRSEESKSCEIPLNNNENKSQTKEV